MSISQYFQEVMLVFIGILEEIMSQQNKLEYLP